MCNVKYSQTVTAIEKNSKNIMFKKLNKENNGEFLCKEYNTNIRNYALIFFVLREMHSIVAFVKFISLLNTKECE